MARIRRPLLVPALLLTIIAAAALAAAFRLNGPPDGGFFQSRRTSASWSVLEEIRSLSSLETASYDMKVVFPFDFVGDDPDVDWAYLKYQYDREPRLFAAKADPAWHPGGRIPDAWRHAGIYELCRRVGIDPGKPDYRFVVISVSVRAGVDLESWLGEFQAGDPDEDVGGIQVEKDTEGGMSLVLTPPPVAVTSFVVKDRDMQAEGFPDVPISPENWGILVDGLSPRLREMALSGGLLETAEQGGRDFLAEIFMGAGYQNVRFSD